MNNWRLHITKLNSKGNNPSNQVTGFNDRVHHTGQRFQQAEANVGARITRPISYQLYEERFGPKIPICLVISADFLDMRVAKKRKGKLKKPVRAFSRSWRTECGRPKRQSDERSGEKERGSRGVREAY